MKNKKYTVKFFKENLPEWKRKKDSLVLKLFFRPLSFITSSIAANLNITANTVSYFSILLAIGACILFIIPNYVCNIFGAILVNLWILSDCTDGNLARAVKTQPFGDFADSASSYILIAFLCSAIGFNVYFNGGMIVEKECIWFVLLGVLASSGDTLMRLIYQKYKASERSLVDQGILEQENDKRTDESQTTSLLVRIEMEFGSAGLLPVLVLFGTIFNMLDLVVIYCFLYYFLAAVIMIAKYLIKSIKRTKEVESRN